jgi:hypothetical protein
LGLAFGFGLGFGFAGVVAVVVAGAAAAVLVVREDDVDEDAPQPATASAIRDDNRIANGRGRVMVWLLLVCMAGDSTSRTPGSAIASRRRAPASILAACTSAS